MRYKSEAQKLIENIINEDIKYHPKIAKYQKEIDKLARQNGTAGEAFIPKKFQKGTRFGIGYRFHSKRQANNFKDDVDDENKKNNWGLTTLNPVTDPDGYIVVNVMAF